LAIYTRPLRRDLAVPVTARRELVTPRRVALLVIVLAHVASIAVASRYVETGAGSWFDAQPKSEFVRAEWLFGWVTPAVHALLGLSAWLVYRRDWPEPERRRALVVLALQVVVISLWAPVLFGAQALDVALLISAAMWLVCLGALTALAPANRWAALLACPAFVWATYAAAVSADLVLEA
jgi:translocator protein